MPTSTLAKARPVPSAITLKPHEAEALSEFLNSADNLLSATWTATGVLQATMQLILDQADHADDPETDGSILSGDLLAAADTLELLKSRLHEVSSHTEQAESAIPKKLRPEGRE